MSEHEAATLADSYVALVEQLVARQENDPFANPVLSVALQVARQLEDGSLDLARLAAVVRQLRDAAFERRAVRLAAYVGLTPGFNAAARFADIAGRLVRPDPHDSPVPLATCREGVGRTRFAAVFTAHPTFALPPALYETLALRASGTGEAANALSHRPGPVTLDQEFAQAVAAIARGRDALDALNEALLDAARGIWPGAWRSVVPRPIILASWVGYDTDGRTDIDWYDTLRMRLRMKHLQLRRLHTQIAAIDGAAELAERLAVATATVDSQLDACPTGPDADRVARFAAILIDERANALIHPDDLEPFFTQLFDTLPAESQLPLAVARAGLRSHGLGLAHSHTRLNATQIHNVARQRLGITDSPEDVSRRRSLLARINEALDTVEPMPVDFGALLSEQVSAARLMMTVAQIVKHIDAASPVRFLIAETESGYTLLVALWLARLFGVENEIEISPLFETADALERGIRVVDEAVRSPHFQTYLRRTGRLCLQFGYSDSGRYVGQLAATYQIERLRLKVGELLAKRGLTDIEVVLFDTHGESIGRGAHPGSLADRLAYLSPAQARASFAAAGIALREESAFQGGDGYALFGTPGLAAATIATIATHAFQPAAELPDPIYDDPDFSADFFAAIGSSMQLLVEDPGYAALLGAFGPALIDKTGSRPSARQTDSSGTAVRIRHPRELRAIPNNAILQQLGWCANTLQGVGAAAARHPEAFDRLLDDSPRFRRALDFAAHALAHSDRDVLRATVMLLDPGTWLDRAAHAHEPARRHELVSVAHGLERLGLWASTQAMSHRIENDYLLLRDAWPDAPHMHPREILLHALRQALIARIWMLSARIPYFAPRHGTTRDTLGDQLLRLDVNAALDQLTLIFPPAPDQASQLDFHEPSARQAGDAYAREHDEIFRPIAELFGLVRELGTAIMHEVGAFG